jgi:chemotaxis regulatin CheY-phosphate phosphatase CheZ
MAFTLNQFQAALNKGAGTVAGAAVAGAVNASDKVNKAVDSTKAATKKAGNGIKGVMPVTNNKLDNLANKYNKRLNNVEMEQRVQEVWIKQLSGTTGTVLADREDIVADLLEADEAEKAAQTTKAVVEAVTNPEMMNMFGTIMERLFGLNPFNPQDDEEEVEVVEEVEVIEEAKPKAEPKKQQKKEEPVVKAETKKNGRKRLGRQAPLAE